MQSIAPCSLRSPGLTGTHPIGRDQALHLEPGFKELLECRFSGFHFRKARPSIVNYHNVERVVKIVSSHKRQVFPPRSSIPAPILLSVLSLFTLFYRFVLLINLPPDPASSGALLSPWPRGLYPIGSHLHRRQRACCPLVLSQGSPGSGPRAKQT